MNGLQYAFTVPSNLSRIAANVPSRIWGTSRRKGRGDLTRKISDIAEWKMREGKRDSALCRCVLFSFHGGRSLSAKKRETATEQSSRFVQMVAGRKERQAPRNNEKESKRQEEKRMVG